VSASGQGPAGDAIFLIREGRPLELTAQPYDSESLLQKLLADYPSLLAGSQIDSASPRRWLLVSREMAVASEEDGGRRWSLDHLFLDQDGVPTLVEVKRSSDSRIRREVVGQMLDYAANAVVHWPVELIQGRLEARSRAASLDPVAELDAFLGEVGGAEFFWSNVETNLQAGRVRLLFVADVIPPELRRVVEFLNEQMDPAEVLAVEIRQYVGEGIRRWCRASSVRRRRRGAGSPRGSAGARTSWDEVSFFAAFGQRNEASVARVARQLFDWSGTQGRVWFGSGERDGSFGLVVTVDGAKRYLFAIYSRGVGEIYFQWLRNGPPFDDEAKRREFMGRLNAIDGVSLPADKIDGRPSFALAALVPPDRLRQFTAALDWAVAEIRAVGTGGRRAGRTD
jgi:hypothetical protein